MQPRVTQAGPLATASATKIAASQTLGAAGYIALNGAATVHTANNICLSQTVTGATAMVINGALATTSPGPITTVVSSVAAYAILPGITNAWFTAPGSRIYITSGGNDSGITFAVVGTDQNNGVLKETITGTNTSIVSSANAYMKILSITTSGSTSAGGATVGTYAPAILDTARRVIITSGGNDTGVTFVVNGRDFAGNLITENVTGASGGAASTVLDYYYVTHVQALQAPATTVTVGTNGVCASPWIQLDTWALANLSGQCVATGTVNFTCQVSNDDPNSYGNPITPANMVWDSNYCGVIAATTSTEFGLSNPPAWIRVLLNSETGTTANVRMTIVQHGSVTY